MRCHVFYSYTCWYWYKILPGYIFYFFINWYRLCQMFYLLINCYKNGARAWKLGWIRVFLVFRQLWVRSTGPAKYSFVEIGHEIFHKAIQAIPLIQVRQLSVIGERMFTNRSTFNCIGLSLPKKSVLRLTDRLYTTVVVVCNSGKTQDPLLRHHFVSVWRADHISHFWHKRILIYEGSKNGHTPNLYQFMFEKNMLPTLFWNLSNNLTYTQFSYIYIYKIKQSALKSLASLDHISNR